MTGPDVPQYDPDDDEWSGPLRTLGYEWCRPCCEWHRPPECWIDSDGRSRLDLMIMDSPSERNDPTMTDQHDDDPYGGYPPGIGGPCLPHDDQPDELPAGDSRDCGHGAYCVQCPPDDPAGVAAPFEVLDDPTVARVPADPDRPCYHPEFEIVTQIARVGEDDANNTMPGMPTAFVAEITIKCGACGEPFKFDGVPAGLSYDAPATSVDGRELRAPIRPVSLPPRRERIRGRAISGYSIRQPGGSPFGLPDDGGRQ